MRIFDLKSDKWLYKISYAGTDVRASFFMSHRIICVPTGRFCSMRPSSAKGLLPNVSTWKVPSHNLLCLFIMKTNQKNIFSCNYIYLTKNENTESQSSESALRLRSSSYLQQCRWEWVDPLMYNTEPVVPLTHWWCWHNRWRLRLSAESNAVTDSQLLWKYGEKNASITSCQLRSGFLRGEDRWHRSAINYRLI